ncbi:MAG: hypothetical protein K0Q70_1586 [Rhodospirillales bacterium]|jgi:hypothetical protein|nr:hypothetical protein [Rhodospirillales bacterium]
MVPSISTVLQFLAILFISLVLGSVFGIWLGYNPAAYSAATFVEVHQGAVRGLNTMLPALALAALVLAAILAFLARARPPIMWLYIASIVAIAIGGVITRGVNQPINAEIMNWVATAPPDNWMELRDKWWHWHVARLVATACGEMLLIAAVFTDRDVRKY